MPTICTSDGWSPVASPTVTGTIAETPARGAPTRPAQVVVASNRMQQLGGCIVQQPQPQLNVAEQPPLLGGAERRRRPELAYAADVVHECRREQQVGAQTRVQLRELMADRGHADR